MTRTTAEERAELIAKAKALIADGMSADRAEMELGLKARTLPRWGVKSPRRPGRYKGRTSRRFSDAERAAIADMWTNYVPIDAIARAVGRTSGVILEYAYNNGWPGRNGAVMQALPRVPHFISRVLFERGEAEFLRIMAKWDARKTYSEHGQAHFRARARAARDWAGMTRNEAIRAKRALGLHLQEIGDEYGITRERVRQICDRKTADRDRPRRYPKTGRRQRAAEKRYAEQWAEHSSGGA